MKTIDEPPYLTVGTDVSAKYRGAFCEAKIKTAKRLVKVKVTFKQDSSTGEVQDDHIKGPLKVGAVVEVKTQDGTFQEAIINKLTDASWYTVVFDDGDEKTLRRSSLCLKGERHFAESETLDQLPLTNPEHFGTPVIGKKSNRGRRSNHVPEEESSSSSSEEDEGGRRLNDDLLGKVVCVECTSAEKKKASWYPALVISPDCNDEVAVKKDNILVRSFKDGKFNVVLRKDVREINSEMAPKPEAGMKPALDRALEFLKSGAVPSNWRIELKEESSSSEEDDDQEEEEDASSEEDEEEVEPFPGESDNFLQQLYKFMEDRGTPINKRPVLGYRNLNLFKLYRLVHRLGGFDNIDSGSVWKQIYQDLGIPVLNSAAGYNVKCAYRKYLYGFEEYCKSTSIMFQMSLPEKSASIPETGRGEEEESLFHKPELTAEKPKLKKEEQEEKATSLEMECKKETETKPSKLCHSQGEKKTEVESKAVKDDNYLEINSLKNEDEEEEVEDNDNEEEEEEEEDERGAPGDNSVNLLKENMKQDQPEEKDISGYDEWIKADKIVRPADKNVPKIKHRKKIKMEKEKDKMERAEREEVSVPKINHIGRSAKSPLNSTPSDSFSKLDSGEAKGAEQTAVKSIEITSILNGLQASESSAEESECEDGDDEDEYEEEQERQGKEEKIGSLESMHVLERWQVGLTLDERRPAMVEEQEELEHLSDTQNSLNKRAEQEGEAESEKEEELKRKLEIKQEEKATERPSKSQLKRKRRNSRMEEWLRTGSHEQIEDRAKPGFTGSSSSEDEDEQKHQQQEEEEEQERTKTKNTLSKKYNGLEEKRKCGRPAGFWDVPDKRPKLLGVSEERLPNSRAKGQKDVWSSIQGQWPKKTLKELFSDSDTEAANSPPPVPPPEEPKQEPAPEEITEKERTEGKLSNEERGEKRAEFPSSGSNSVLNTPPTTPESPSLSGSRMKPNRTPPAAPPPPAANPLPPPPAPSATAHRPVQEESVGGRSETDSSTVEVESLGGELQEVRSDGGGSPMVFDSSLSSNSSSSSSVLINNSNNSLPEREHMEKVATSQKRHKDAHGGASSKKQKRSHKNSDVHPKKSKKTAHSSESEDQSASENAVKSPPAKSTASLKPASQPKRPGRTHSPGRFSKHGDSEHKEPDNRSSRVYKWSFQMSDLEKMTSVERVAFLQEKLQDIRSHYISLKSEVASIDRRRKRLKKKERESAAAASSSSSSSSPSSSSITAAVMLTLSEPPVSGSSQNSGSVSVECR
ncbi:AT-rich interactive domain-containing protein 4B isoform X4 [Polyodon spathula]|uniref:AT-rich interactive domain-containing protein 4B isoform X4 n=1 Tax=Polyodon spathula TaxID=7913 RepID=UPI001B7E4444|nr:AT-rich interactive domain-containing protein 4B isoform X4 [Polyodon spathula]